MTPPKRLTPEREAEIRKALDQGNAWESDLRVCLSEIDALEAENEHLFSALAGRSQEHFKHLEDKLKLKDENQKLKIRVAKLREAFELLTSHTRLALIDALEAENEDLKVINEVLTNHSGKLESKLRSRIAKLRGVLEDWLACTPSEASGKYSEITQWNACRALEALAQDDSGKDVSDEESGK